MFVKERSSPTIVLWQQKVKWIYLTACDTISVSSVRRVLLGPLCACPSCMIERRTMAQVATQLVSSVPVRAFLARFRRAEPPVEPTIHLNVFPQRLSTESTQSAMAFLMAAHCADVSLLSLEISAGVGRITFGLTCRASARSYLESQIAAQYPGAVMDEASDSAPGSGEHYGLCLTLS